MISNKFSARFHDLSTLLAGVAFKGKVLIYGTLSPYTSNINTRDILRRDLTVSGFAVADINADPTRLRAAKDYIGTWKTRNFIR